MAPGFACSRYELTSLQLRDSGGRHAPEYDFERSHWGDESENRPRSWRDYDWPEDDQAEGVDDDLGYGPALVEHEEDEPMLGGHAIFLSEDAEDYKHETEEWGEPEWEEEMDDVSDVEERGPTPGFLANGGVKNISSTAGSAHRPVRQPEPEGPISALVRNGAFFQEGGSSSSTAKRPQHGKGVQHQPSQLPAPLRAPSFPQGGEEPDPNPPSQPPSPSQLLRDLNAEIERENLRQPFLYFNTGEQGQQEDQRTHKIFEDGRTTTPMYMLHSAGVNIRIRALMGKQTTDSRARLLQARREKLLAQINAMDGALEDCVRNLLASNPAYQNDVANLSALGCSFLIIWDKLPAEKQKELGEQAPQLGGCARDLRAYWDQTTQLCELLQWKWRMLQQIIQTEVDLDNMQHEDQQRNIESGRIGPSDQTRQLQQQNKILQDKYSEFDDIVRLVQMNRIAEPDITPLGDKDQEKTLAQIRFLEERLDLMRNVQEAGEELRSIDLEMTQLENTKKSQYHDIDDIETDLQNALPIGAGRNPLQNIRRRLSSSMEESSDVRARELGRQLQQLEQRRKAMLEEIEELNRQYMVLHAQRAEVDRELLDTEHLGSKSMHVSLGLGAPDAVRQLDEHIQMGPDFQIPGKRPLLQSMALDLKAQREELSKVIVARHQELRALRDKVDAVCEMQVTHRAEESGGEIGLDALFPRSVLEKDGVDQFLRTRVGAAVDHDPVHRQISAMVDPLGSYLQYHHERDALRQGRLRSSVLGHIGKWNGETVQSARERQKKNAADADVRNADFYYAMLEGMGTTENSPKRLREWNENFERHAEKIVGGHTADYVQMFYPETVEQEQLLPDGGAGANANASAVGGLDEEAAEPRDLPGGGGSSAEMKKSGSPAHDVCVAAGLAAIKSGVEGELLSKTQAHKAEKTNTGAGSRTRTEAVKNLLDEVSRKESRAKAILAGLDSAEKEKDEPSKPDLSKQPATSEAFSRVASMSPPMAAKGRKTSGKAGKEGTTTTSKAANNSSGSGAVAVSNDADTSAASQTPGAFDAIDAVIAHLQGAHDKGGKKQPTSVGSVLADTMTQLKRTEDLLKQSPLKKESLRDFASPTCNDLQAQEGEGTTATEKASPVTREAGAKGNTSPSASFKPLKRERAKTNDGVKKKKQVRFATPPGTTKDDEDDARGRAPASKKAKKKRTNTTMARLLSGKNSSTASSKRKAGALVDDATTEEEQQKFLYYREKFSDVPLGTENELSREFSRRKWVDKIEDLESQIEEKNKLLLKVIQRPNLITRRGGIPLDEDPDSGMTIHGSVRATELNRSLAKNIRDVMDTNLREFLHDELHQKRVRELNEVVAGLKKLETEETLGRMRQMMNELCEIKKQPDFGNYYKKTSGGKAGSTSFGYELPNERQMQAMHERFVDEYMRKDALGSGEVGREAASNLRHIGDPVQTALQAQAGLGASIRLGPPGGAAAFDPSLGGNPVGAMVRAPWPGQAPPNVNFMAGGGGYGLPPGATTVPTGMLPGGAPPNVNFMAGGGGYGLPPGATTVPTGMLPGGVGAGLPPGGVPAGMLPAGLSGAPGPPTAVAAKLRAEREQPGPSQQKAYQPAPTVGRDPILDDLASACSTLRQNAAGITEGMPFVATGPIDFARPWMTEQLHFAAAHDAQQLGSAVDQIMLQMRLDEAGLERSGIQASLGALRDVLISAGMGAMHAVDFEMGSAMVDGVQQEIMEILGDFGLFGDLRDALHEKYLGQGAWDFLQTFLQSQSASNSVQRQDIGKLLQAMGIDMHFRNLIITAVHVTATHLFRTCVSAAAERDPKQAANKKLDFEQGMPTLQMGQVNRALQDQYPLWNRRQDPEFAEAANVNPSNASIPNVVRELPLWTSNALEKATRVLAYDVKKRLLFLSKKVAELKTAMRGGRGRMMLQDRHEVQEMKYWQPKLVEIQGYQRQVGDLRRIEAQIDEYTPDLREVAKGDERMEVTRAQFDCLMRLQFTRQALGMKVALYGNQLYAFTERMPQDLDFHSTATHWMMDK
eukprot:g7093.t1